MPAAMARYAKACAQQVERDFEVFRAACQKGELPVLTDDQSLRGDPKVASGSIFYVAKLIRRSPRSW